MELDHDPESAAIESEFRASITQFAFDKGGKQRENTSSPRRRSSDDTPTKKRARGRDLNALALVDDLKSEPEPKKKKRRIRGYASPETYAHLRELQDHLEEGLDLVFCGINPGQKSAQLGHHFAHPTNHFWVCLHESGFTPTRIPPEADHTLPKRFSIGLTNLVERPTAEQNELSVEEQTTGVPTLLTKIFRYRPRVVCFVGLGIAKIIRKGVLNNPPTSFTLEPRPSNVEDTPTLKSKPKSKRPKLSQQESTLLGLQPYKIVYRSPPNDATSSSAHKTIPDPGSPPLSSDIELVAETLFYALPSTSARVISPQRAGKIELFRELKGFIERVKRGEVNTDAMHVLRT